MTCIAMRDRMLEAELDELSGAGDSPLATHLRECESCGVMARRIVSDTTMLAIAVAPLPRVTVATLPRTGVLRRRVAVGLAAAALLAIVARQWLSPIEPPVTPPARYASIAAAIPAPSPKTKDPTEPSPRRRAGRDVTTKRRASAALTRAPRMTPMLAVAAVTNAPVLVAALEPPVAVAPVRLDVPPRDPLGIGVAVHPPTGTRADILRTADPSVTVVWLYR